MDYDKYSEISTLFETEKYENAAAILISIEGDQVKINSYGGQFRTEGRFAGEEVYEMLTCMLDTAKEFNGNLNSKDIH